jgi:hypothetical protein
VGQVDLAHRALVADDVDLEPRVLHAVQREVLDRRDHVVGLDALRQRRAHLADVVRVLAIGLLCAPPRRVAQQVDADRPRQRAPLRPRLHPHDLADAALQVRVEAGPPRHAAGEASALAPRHAPRPVGEVERRQAQPRATPACRVRVAAPAVSAGLEHLHEAAAAHHGDLLVERQLGQHGFDRVGDLRRGHTLAGPEFPRGRLPVGHASPSFIRLGY